MRILAGSGLVQMALELTNLNVADYLLRLVAEVAEGELQASAATAPGAESDGATEAWQEFLAEASKRGFPAMRSFAVALGTRVFRSGSNPLTDKALLVAYRRWESLEESLGFALDHRTACACSPRMRLS